MDIENIGSAAMKTAENAASGKFENILGKMFPFWGKKQRAVDAYINEIEKGDLPPEIKMMQIYNVKKTFNELKNQSAIIEIAQSNAKEGTDFSTSSSVDDEWLSRFMDAAKHVSDEKVQLLWGKILAGEFESPQSTAPSVIRILSEITTKYATYFANLCSLKVMLIRSDSSGTPQKITSEIIVSTKTGGEYLNKLGITFSTLSELATLGLIQFDNINEFILRIDNAKYPIISVLLKHKTINCIAYPNQKFPMGEVILTHAGASIAQFINEEPPVDFDSYIFNFFNSERGVQLSE